jgi:hypothetical protein
VGKLTFCLAGKKTARKHAIVPHACMCWAPHSYVTVRLACCGLENRCSNLGVVVTSSFVEILAPNRDVSGQCVSITTPAGSLKKKNY